LQRFGRALERILSLAEIVPGRGDPRIGLDRRAELALRTLTAPRRLSASK
jgi:hypothetical protein